jgi:pimeloyl-ACP methyl ester carboxylesterase
MSAAAPPPLRLLFGEARALPALARFAAKDRTPGLPTGDGHAVIVLPGLLAGDALTLPLRRALVRLGYDARGWTFGANLGLKPGLLSEMQRYVREVHAGTRRKVSLIGWSLGGLYARELAKRLPGHVRLVITLGSPAMGDRRANNAWRLYERLNDHSVDSPPIDTRLDELPPVPVTSILTPDDGIVPPAAADIGTGPSWETVRVGGTHVGLAWNAAVLRVIADRLAQPEGEWLPIAIR